IEIDARVANASMHKHLRCQTVTSRAIGDKELFREVSNNGRDTGAEKETLRRCRTRRRSTDGIAPRAGAAVARISCVSSHCSALIDGRPSESSELLVAKDKRGAVLGNY